MTLFKSDGSVNEPIKSAELDPHTLIVLTSGQDPLASCCGLLSTSCILSRSHVLTGSRQARKRCCTTLARLGCSSIGATYRVKCQE